MRIVGYGVFQWSSFCIWCKRPQTAYSFNQSKWKNQLILKACENIKSISREHRTFKRTNQINDPKEMQKTKKEIRFGYKVLVWSLGRLAAHVIFRNTRILCVWKSMLFSSAEREKEIARQTVTRRSVTVIMSYDANSIWNSSFEPYYTYEVRSYVHKGTKRFTNNPPNKQ